jgi:hypothetical protein
VSNHPPTPALADLVEIRWSDIVTDDAWGDDEGPLHPVESLTVGYLLEETPTMIVIASSYDFRAETWGTKHSFPKNPPEITTIREAKK